MFSAGGFPNPLFLNANEVEKLNSCDNLQVKNIAFFNRTKVSLRKTA
jgi:hypothetical protein